LVAVFREVRRVLRDDGTLWVNLGDSYASGGMSGPHKGLAAAAERSDGKARNRSGARAAYDTSILRAVPSGLKPKDLIGVPWRVAFALQADGWYLRQDIIWAKPNPMPESVRDRCTKAHEYVFLLSKGPRYYFDAEAISEPLGEASIARLSQNVEAQAGSERVPGKTNGAMKDVGGRRAAGNKTHRGQAAYEAGEERFRTKAGLVGFAERERAKVDAGDLEGTRNKRSVWTVATQPYKEAHFATYPPELIEPCILAGCPAGGTVLDPFGGAGTTGLVADRLQRNAVLIELNPAYAAIAQKRLEGDAGMFSQVEAA
jgi:DNA modification methylase